MTRSAEPQVENRLGGTRRQIDLIIKELAGRAEQDLPPAEFYGSFLQATLDALAGVAAAVWLRGADGRLELHHHLNLRQAGLDSEESRRLHDDLLREALQLGRPVSLPPGAGDGADGVGARNPTPYLVLISPVRIDGATAGLVEVWQRPDCRTDAVAGFVYFLGALAGMAASYERNRRHRELAGVGRLWTRLEAFALEVQGSLNPTEVAYQVANEGRRLIECDRLSVAVRHGRAVTVEAVSGAEAIERRSRQVRLMQALFREVLAWGETVVFRGVPDPDLPPAVVRALNAYLEASPSKLLAVLPLRDPREKDSPRPARSALLLESFDPAQPAEQLLARAEVVGKHATRALYNAAEYRRIPLGWVWRPLARLQEGVGGKARAVAALIIVAVVALVAALVFVPYPLKMDARGQLLPEERRWIYSPVEGHVLKFGDRVRSGEQVVRNQDLILMYDLQQQLRIEQLNAAIESAQEEASALAGQLSAAQTEADRRRISAEKREKEFIRDSKREELRALRERTHAVEGRPGEFWLKSPIQGTVLSWDFRENLTNRFVKPSDPLLRIGDKTQGWEVEVKIPQKHVGQVLRAFEREGADELDVDLLVLSAPTRTFKGKLVRGKVSAEAAPSRDEGPEAEPVVLASVRIDGPDIPAADRLPRDLLVAGTEVHCRVRCGRRALGYALFYGVWEFVYDKVVFFF